MPLNKETKPKFLNQFKFSSSIDNLDQVAFDFYTKRSTFNYTEEISLLLLLLTNTKYIFLKNMFHFEPGWPHINALVVMVTIWVNGHDDPSLTPGRDCLHFI